MLKSLFLLGILILSSLSTANAMYVKLRARELDSLGLGFGKELTRKTRAELNIDFDSRTDIKGEYNYSLLLEDHWDIYMLAAAGGGFTSSDIDILGDLGLGAYYNFNKQFALGVATMYTLNISNSSDAVVVDLNFKISM